MSNINQHKPGYKHTPLGWIPEEWEVKELQKVITLVNGRAFKPNEWDTVGLPIIRIQNLNDKHALFNYYDKEVENRYYVNSGDILFAWSGTKGVSFGARIWTNGTAILNQHIFKVLPKLSALTKRYSYLVLLRVQTNIETKAHGFKSSFVHVKKFDLDKILLPLPPLDEQKIVEKIFSTWDEAITQTQQLIAQLKQRNKGLMQQLLTPKDDWKEKNLFDIFDRVVRKNTINNTNVVTISAQRGFIKQNDFFKKLVASEMLNNYFLVRKGEFCYNKSYSNGYDWGATKRLNDFEEAVVTTLYICFGLKDENKHSGDYFEYFFDANVLDRGLAKIAHEGGRAHGLLNVTPSDFFNLKIYVPHYEEQIRILKTLSAAKSELKLHEQKLAALQQQKKGLMQKLLTGEVRVKI